MFAANTYRMRLTSYDHADTIARLVDADSGRPIFGRVLIGYLNGVPAAVLSLDDGRVFVDPSRGTDHLVANLRVRAIGIWADEESDSLRERLLAGIPASFRARVAAASGSMSQKDRIEQEPVVFDDLEQHAGLLPGPDVESAASLSAVMGPPNRSPGLALMGDSDRLPRIPLMGEPARGPRVDVMGGPDTGPSLRLMGESDPAFVDALFTGSADATRRPDPEKRPAEARWSLAPQPAGQP